MTASPPVPLTIAPFEVTVPAKSLERFRAVPAPEQMDALERAVEEGRRPLEGRVVWNVNSTA
jgi:hypothetical protein